MTDTAPAATAVAPLSAFSAADIDLVGGKAANLGELIAAGLPVPDGFAITTNAYRAAAAHAGLAPGADIPAERLRAGFAAAEVPEPLRTEIRTAYAALGGGPVAVRSSATAEDLPGAAFAGQQDTFLNVTGADALLDAVRRCWGSLWTDRATAYRERIGIPGDTVAIAVAVQKMAPADWAGVLFTADPVTGARDRVVVDAGQGLGEAVVSGLVTPEHDVLDRSGRLLQHRPGRGEVVVRPVEGGGVAEVRGSAAPPRMPREALAALVRLGVRIAEHYGRPMDVEWAVAGGEPHILQARPMTAVPPPPLRLNRRQRLVGPTLLDMFTERPYPMDVSSWTGALLGHVRAMAGGLAGMHFPPLADILTEEDGIVTAFVPPSPRPTRATPRRIASTLRRSRRFAAGRLTADPRFAEFERRLAELSATDLAALDWAGLRGLPRRALQLVDTVTALRIDYLPSWIVPMARLQLVLAVLGRRRDSADLLYGAVTKTEETNRELERLAGQVRADPELSAAFAEHSPEELAAALDSTGAAGGEPGGGCGGAGPAARDAALRGFAADFTRFLGAYGNRETTSAVYVSTPSWGAAPHVPLGLVKVLASAPPQHDTGRAAAALDRLLSHPLLRAGGRDRVRRLVERVRAGVAVREDTHFHFTRVQPVLRRALLEIGARLAADGVLSAPGDIWHLRLEEVEAISALPAPGAERDRLRAAVQHRAARRAEMAGVRLLDLHTAGLAPAAEGGALAAGTPACGGTAQGPVRVVLSADDFGRMRSGDILVCPYTNPSWTPLFQRAAAVVVDSGGIGSHAAIVAREYGIPAIMGTGKGTAVLADGVQVRVDGDAGRVYPAE